MASQKFAVLALVRLTPVCPRGWAAGIVVESGGEFVWEEKLARSWRIHMSDVSDVPRVKKYRRMAQ